MSTTANNPAINFLAYIAIAGCAAVLVADISMWFIIEGYNPLRQTISELAAGPYHSIQDAGIVAYAIGIVALAIASRLKGQTGGRAGWLQIALLVLAAATAMIALWNEYGDGDTGGLVIHKWLLGVLYLAVAAIIWLSRNLDIHDEESGGKFSGFALLLWLVSAPALFLMPNAIYGGYERVLAAAMVAVVALSARGLLKG